MKRQAAEWAKVFAIPIGQKWFVSTIYKKTPTIKKIQSSLLKNEQRPWAGNAQKKNIQMVKNIYENGAQSPKLSEMQIKTIKRWLSPTHPSSY